MTKIKRTISWVITAGILISGINVFAEESLISRLASNNTADDLVYAIGGLTSGERAELGLDFTKYNKIAYPEFVAEEILVNGFSTADEFKAAFDSAVEKTLEEKKIYSTYGVCINETDETQNYTWKPGITFSNALGIYYTTVYVGFDIPESKYVSDLELTLCYSSSFTNTRGSNLYNYSLADYPPTPKTSEEYTQNSNYDKSTEIYSQWVDFHAESIELPSNQRTAWNVDGTDPAPLTVTNRLNDEIIEAVQLKDSTPLSLRFYRGNNVTIMSNPDSGDETNPCLTVIYDNSIKWHERYTSSISDGQTGIYNLDEISIGYGADIDASLWNDDNIALINAETGENVRISFTYPGIIELNEQLENETSYILTIRNIKDTDGILLNSRRIYFTTAGIYKSLRIDTNTRMHIGETSSVDVYGQMTKKEVKADADIAISNTMAAEYSTGQLTALDYGYTELTAEIKNIDETVVSAREIITVPVNETVYDFEDETSSDSYEGEHAYVTAGAVKSIETIAHSQFAVTMHFKDDMGEKAENYIGFDGARIEIGAEVYNICGMPTEVKRSEGWHKTVFVYDGEALNIYIDGVRVYRGDADNFEFKIFGAPGELVADYVITARLNDKEPEIKNLTLIGNSETDAILGDTLKAVYEYYDEDGDESEGTEGAWYVSDSPDGEYKKASDTDELYISSEYLSKYIKYAVIPKNAISTGAAYETEPIYISLGKTLTKVLNTMQNTDSETAEELIREYADILELDITVLNDISDTSYVFNELAGRTYADTNEIVNAFNNAIDKYIVYVSYPVVNALSYSTNENKYIDVTSLQRQNLYLFQLYLTTENIKDISAARGIYLAAHTGGDSAQKGSLSEYYINERFNYTDTDLAAEKFSKLTDAIKGVTFMPTNEMQIKELPKNILDKLKEDSALTVKFTNTGSFMVYLNGALQTQQPYFRVKYDKTALMAKEAAFDIENGQKGVAHDLQSVNIEFYTDVNEETVTNDNIYIIKEASGEKISAELQKTDTNKYSIVINEGLEDETAYRIVMENVCDTLGNVLGERSIRFTTEYIVKNLYIKVKTSFSIGDTAAATIMGIAPSGSEMRMSGVSYSSSDTTVADIDSRGNITAMQRGTAVITASFKNYDGSVVVNKLIINVYNKNENESFETNVNAVNDYAYSGILSLPVENERILITSSCKNYAELNFYDAGEANAQITFGGMTANIGSVYGAGSKTQPASRGWHQIVFDNRNTPMTLYIDGEPMGSAAFSGDAAVKAIGDGIYVDNININDISGEICIAKNVAIRGSSTPGSALTASYGYSDADNDIELGTICTWYTASSENGNYTKTAEGTTYTVKSSDRFVKLGVTPQNIYDTGAEVFSPILKITAGGGSGGSGGSSGANSPGGGASPSAVVNINTAEQQQELSKNNDFTDVPKEHWAYSAVSNMRSAGIIKGVGENMFNPDGLVTRAEFAAMVVRALALENSKYTGIFSDVSAEDWFASVVQTAYDNGIVNGYGESFVPNDNITREQMVKIIMCAYQKLHTDFDISDNTADFEDINEAGEWSRKYIAAANRLGIISGTGENRFEPLGNATRAQAAIVINNMLED